MVDEIRELAAFELDYRAQIILTGNGLALLNREGKKWEGIITEMLKKHRSPYPYSDIKNIPASMQAIIASNNTVDKEMGWLADELEKIEDDENQIECISKLLSIPADAILSTNYSFEIERTGYEKGKRSVYRKIRLSTKNVTKTEDQRNLYKYFQFMYGGKQKNIWHIHGEMCKPSSMIMGHYYYGKLLAEIQNRVPILMKEYHSCQKKNTPFKPKSWVDLFLISDVYILGLSMYLCEIDLWWLIECKKRNFPETKVYFYGEAQEDVYKMLWVYGVDLCTEVQLTKGDYKQFYIDAINDISDKINSSKDHLK